MTRFVWQSAGNRVAFVSLLSRPVTMMLLLTRLAEWLGIRVRETPQAARESRELDLISKGACEGTSSDSQWLTMLERCGQYDPNGNGGKPPNALRAPEHFVPQQSAARRWSAKHYRHGRRGLRGNRLGLLSNEGLIDIVTNNDRGRREPRHSEN